MANAVVGAYSVRGQLVKGALLAHLVVFIAPPLALAMALQARGIGWRLLNIIIQKSKLIKRELRCCNLAHISIWFVTAFTLLGLLVSLDPSNSFQTSKADPGGSIGAVPWFTYPVLLGLSVPLGTIGLIELSKKQRTIAGALMLLALLAVALGRLNTWVNTMGIETGYWGEKRFVIFVYMALAPPTVLVLSRALEGASRSALAALLFIILILSPNTLVVTSFWGLGGKAWRISDEEAVVLAELRARLWDEPERWILSPSIRSRDATAFAAPIYYVFFPPSFFLRTDPCAVLPSFYVYGLGPPYLFIDWSRDANTVRSGWVGRHLLPLLPKVASSGPVEAYNVPELSPPLPGGAVALALPLAPLRVDHAYLLLSLAGVNYTPVLEVDPALSRYGIIVVPYDPVNGEYRVKLDLVKVPIVETSSAVQLRE
ncbi:hypothetical protein, partial [Infirmifilum sp.]|uniref:hypothetical protein n=1 Tax=Infirmifilum sp. TaxID=2856575 RepID=UPI003D0AAEA7